MAIVHAILVACSTLAFRPPFNDAWMREAEIKHGRVAMLAFPTLAQISTITNTNPVSWLAHQPVDTQIYFFSAAAVFESLNLRRLGYGFVLKEGEEPGKLFQSNHSAGFDVVETNVGRIAMIATFEQLVGTF